MSSKPTTHTARVQNWNYGNPYTYAVKLREGKTHWISDTGARYRKTNGHLVGAGGWCQTTLQLETINKD